MPLRVAAISFLNPAPLLYDFEHEPGAARLRTHYDVRYTLPAACAAQLLAGEADLGLVPIAALTAKLAVVPGCTIASLGEVRSILLLVKNPAGLDAEGASDIAAALRGVKTVGTDAASRSSVAYARILFEHFVGVRPEFGVPPAFIEQPADAVAMLAACDAALLIGDPALLARERPGEIEAAVSATTGKTAGLLWLDMAALWRERTGLPWVAAVWAVRPEAIAAAGLTESQLIADLNASRENGCAHVEELVAEWTPRLAVSPATIRAYLTRNIHYELDEACVRSIVEFRRLAAEVGALPELGELKLLEG